MAANTAAEINADLKDAVERGEPCRGTRFDITVRRVETAGSLQASQRMSRPPGPYSFSPRRFDPYRRRAADRSAVVNLPAVPS